MRFPRGVFTQYVPTWRLAIVVAVLAPVWMLSETAAGTVVPLSIVALLVLALVCDALLIPGKQYITITRTLPPTVGVGDTVSGTYTITNTAWRTVRVMLFDALPHAVWYSVAPRSCRVARAASAHASLTITGRERGTHALGVVVARVSGPLDFVRRSLRYPMTDTLTVMPSIAGARGHHLQALQRRTRVAGMRAVRLRGASSTFSGLRDYVEGDDPRYIDWKATARRSRVTSREFAVEQGQTVVIAVDAGRMMTQFAGDRPRFEYALSSALLLADVALAGGDRVGMILFNDVVRAYVAPARGTGARHDIRAALTAASATMVEPDYAAAFRTLATRQRRRSMIVLFTDVIDARSSASVIAHTVRTAQRHVPLVVALRNDQVTAASLPATDASLDAVYDAVAAEELLLARADALERMRQRGVAVLDTPPQGMTAAVVNRYLELKERAAL